MLTPPLGPAGLRRTVPCAALMPDPAAVVGTETEQRAAFNEALRLISWRIGLMLALPLEKLERLALETRMQAIGTVGTAKAPAGGVVP